MDVAKYIGLFLLKNNFVYIHGLGNLELKKRASSYNGESLEAASYDVIMTQIGSIDDNLANFIATNEQVSISKASNALREFSMAARADLMAGKTVEIPSIGKFAEERGRTIFVMDPAFQYKPASIPAMKIARRQDETPFTTSADIPPVRPRYEETEEDRESGGGISWVKISLWVLVLAIIGALGYLGVRYMNRHNSTNDAPLIQTPVKDTLPVMQQQPVMDTTLQREDTAMAAAPYMNDSAKLNLDVILNTYVDLAKAERRADKLKSFGNPVELVASDDSTQFYVILPVTQVQVSDTAKLLDSLKRTFNPTYGVRILP